MTYETNSLIIVTHRYASNDEALLKEF